MKTGLLCLFVVKEAEGVRERTIGDYYLLMKYFKKILNEFYPEVKYLHEISSSIVRQYIVFMRKEKGDMKVKARESDRGKFRLMGVDLMILVQMNNMLLLLINKQIR